MADTTNAANIPITQATVVYVPTGVPLSVTATPAVAGPGAGATAERVVIASDQTPIPTVSAFVTKTFTITRPADTNAYTAEDALSDSTSAPTAVGYVITGAGRASGGSGIITDAIVMMSTKAGTAIQGELWIFDTTVTNINDNAAFSISDADAAKLVAVIPFTADRSGTLNYAAHVKNLAIGFTCVGSANLYALVKVINAYTPASAEILTARLKITQVD